MAILLGGSPDSRMFSKRVLCNLRMIASLREQLKLRSFNSHSHPLATSPGFFRSTLMLLPLAPGKRQVAESLSGLERCRREVLVSLHFNHFHIDLVNLLHLVTSSHLLDTFA